MTRQDQEYLAYYRTMVTILIIPGIISAALKFLYYLISTD